MTFPLSQLLRRFALSLSLLLALPALAQPQPASEPLLQGKGVTAEALVNALSLPEDADRPRTRGLRPVAPAKPGAAAPAGKANLLITFLTNSSQLTPEAEGIVATLAQAMKAEALAGMRFKVQGHADARGDPQVNLALSQSRAAAVARELSQRHGIAADRLDSEGRGSAEPLNKQRVDAPENRRVTVISSRAAPTE
jgi:outer membrane protein OmpA-like peptidoglycan-associated protein